MLIIGETINTSKEEIKLAVENRDAAFIVDLAKRQIDAGAEYLDINCGTMVHKEPEVMAWLIETIQEQIPAALICIDSPNPKAIEVALSLIKNGRPIIDSTTAEKQRFKEILPLILKYDAKIIALCMDDSGVPELSADRLRIAKRLVEDLTAAGVKQDDIYLDPLVKPLSTGDKTCLEFLKTVYGIKQMYPDVHCSCGLSNVSYGLPNPKTLNQTFMIQTMTMGMDSYILDVLDRRMMGFIYTSQALLGQDEYCAKYLAAHRNGLYKGVE